MRMKNLAFGWLMICLVFALLIIPITASPVLAANSIVGTWNGYVDWSADGSPVSAGPWTFNADGTWTYSNGGGRWIQVGDMVAWNFSNAAGLIYTANLSRNSMQGIMGYASSTTSIKGCFYALPQTTGSKLAIDSLPRTDNYWSSGTEKEDLSIGPVEK